MAAYTYLDYGSMQADPCKFPIASPPDRRQDRKLGSNGLDAALRETKRCDT